jgi:hypothetical protein
VFDGDRLTTSTRRLVWGGVALGFAGTMKAWAIVPVLVIALLCLPGLRRAALFVAGVAAGFIIPVLPFAAAAPRAFYDDVVVAQLARIGTRDPVWHRLGSMIGIPGAEHWARSTVVLAWLGLVVFVVLVQAAALLVTRQQPPPLEWFATASAALIVVMFLWPPYFASHYSAFFGPFLALTLALPVSRLAAAAPGPAPASARAGLARAGLVLLAVAVLAGAVAQAPTRSLSRARRGSPAAAGRAIPPGACVVTDQASYLLLANRFTSNVPGCTQMVDGLGTDLALSAGRRPGSGANHVPAVAAAWSQAFSHAGYVLLSPKNSLRIPWTPALTSYFHQNFRRVLHGYAYTLYQRRPPGSGSG